MRSLFAAVAAAFMLPGSVTAAPLPPPPTKAAVAAACHPGRDPQELGNDDYPGGLSKVAGALTPRKLPGATTVSAAEGKCIIDKFGRAVVIVAAMNDPTMLENALTANLSSTDDPVEQKMFIDWLSQWSEGRKDRPILTYCHHESCFLSYNLSLRAVQGGFSQVYWMRPGIEGWVDAGYPLGAEPGEKVARSDVGPRIAECYKNHSEYSAEKWGNMVRQMPTETEQQTEFNKQVKDARYWVNLCLDNRIRDAKGAADKAAFQAERARSDAKVGAVYAAARREMEANPAKYLAPWSSSQPDQLRKSLAALRAYQTLEQACGRVDLGQPPIGPQYNAANNRRVDELNRFIDCINAYDDKPSLFSERFNVEQANEWVGAARRFTCRAGWKSNCIPNEPYATIARLADESALALANRVETLAGEQRARYRQLGDQLNKWRETFHQRVQAFNASH